MHTVENTLRIVWVPETVSTNSLLRAMADEEILPEGSVVVADFQTAGRGQMGNSWESEAGKNLSFSVVVYPSFLPANRPFLISQITSLSVRETLGEYMGDVTVKWPNDIYWRDKKICGMLIENDLTGHHVARSILGIGININQTVFRGGAPNPVSLAHILRREVNREEVLHGFLAHFYAYYARLRAGEVAGIRRLYKEALYRKEGFHPYRDAKGVFEARIADIEPTGHLLLALRDESLRRYAFKEVVYL